MANEGQRQYFADAMRTKRWPTREPFTAMAIPPLLEVANLRPGMSVLDIGCGGGQATKAVASIVGPTGRVVGADISEAMLELANSRRELSDDNVSYVLADAQTDLISGAPFDAVVSQFGLMFFEDPVAAFTNLRAHLKAGGAVTGAVWQGMEKNLSFMAHRLAARGFQRALPKQGPVPQGPFAFADQEYVNGLLLAAGFNQPQWTLHSAVRPCALEDIVTVQMLLNAGIDQDRVEEAYAIAVHELTAVTGDDGVVQCPLEIQIFSCTAP
ncbi:MAG: class I SAM-dependent methyltransferase [Actinomycetota bacterium]